MGTKYFTADLHFGHANIIKFCNRPFKSVEDMDKTLIRNWNETVQPDDEIYIKRVYTPVFVSSFVRSYQAAKAGIYKNFGGGFKSELPRCEKGFNAPEYSFAPNLEEKKTNEIVEWLA